MSIERAEIPIDLSRLARVVKVLDSSKLPYYILGGFVIYAVMGKYPNRKHTRFDGESEDIDILTPNPRAVGEVLRTAGCLKKSWLEVLFLRGRRIDLGINKVVDLTDPNNPRLRYGSIVISLPRDIFVTNRVDINGLNFPTLPAETLSHLYYLSWFSREDVLSRGVALENWIREHPSDNLPEGAYERFIEYHRLRQAKYPFQALKWRLFLNLQQWLRNKINIAKGAQLND